MVLVTLLADDGVHAALPDYIFLADISGIKPEVLPLVLLINERCDDVGVMHAGICGVVLLDDLCLLVGLDVVLVAIVVLAALLRPAGIDVLVAALVGLALAAAAKHATSTRSTGYFDSKHSLLRLEADDDSTRSTTPHQPPYPSKKHQRP